MAQRFPNAELAPLSAFAMAQVQEFNSYLCSTVHVAHAHGRRGARWADDAAAIEAMKRKVPATMTECFELIERKLLKGPWVMGEQYTICDPYLFTIGTWFEGDGVDTTKLPRVMEHRKRMLARPAEQKAVATEGTQNRLDWRALLPLRETVDALCRAAEQLSLLVGRVAGG